MVWYVAHKGDRSVGQLEVKEHTENYVVVDDGTISGRRYGRRMEDRLITQDEEEAWRFLIVQAEREVLKAKRLLDETVVERNIRFWCKEGKL